MAENPGPADPAGEYRSRLETRRSQLEVWSRYEGIVSVLRLVAMVVLGVVAWLAVQSQLFALAWTLLPLNAFVILVLVHRRLLDREAAERRAAEYYERGLARIEDRWHGTGPTGRDLADPEHRYAGDLDIFGDRSLFQLLCSARTGAGERRLAAWLCERADRLELEGRQEAVATLTQAVTFREDIWRLSGEVAETVHPETLIEWSCREDPALPRLLPGLLVGLAVVQLVGVIGWVSLGWGPTLLLAALLAHTVGGLFLRQRVMAPIVGAEGAGRDLEILGAVLARIERESFDSGVLGELLARLREGPDRPAVRIRQLQRRVDLLESRKNPLFAPLGILAVWTPLLAVAIDSWRRQVGPHVAEWIDIAAEIEALNCLAGYAYEHPADPFPEIVDEPLLEGSSLGHPLLAADSFVRNDIHLDSTRPALVVSGSNMSGKSTYLRTIGINAVLAMAGAPVRAAHMRLSPIDVGASVQLHDSLQEGRSRFYAEILRLRQVLDLVKQSESSEATTLFLLDEILHGTNSHDRRLGAEALVRSLLDRGAIGLVTTHDLALAEIGNDDGITVTNVHFGDEIADGKIIFDYRVRPGVVEKSNALALMREVGLEV
ncbi:MAG: DNA mismatch repair protein MutS [Acidobacteriota bacterium]|nr:DNA mismatch repair protein MutS [Acidobacteriota bacterium]